MVESVEKSKILIVDDTPENLTVLQGLLKNDYKLFAAKNGEKALALAHAKLPSLVLLDIMMPGMDGYEVCKRLKADPATRDIPVVFLTAMANEEDEAKGLALGAVDYVTKPFSPDLVKSRVKNHLQLKLAMDALKEQNDILEENAKLKEDVERITRHDLKSPLNAIIAYPVMMQGDKNLTEEQIDNLKTIGSSGRKMLNMINLSLDLYKMETGTYDVNDVDFDLLSVFREIEEESWVRVLSKRLEVLITVNGLPVDEGSNCICPGEKLLVYSMLANLFKNAVDASPKDEEIAVKVTQTEEIFSISIHNIGVVPSDIQNTFFDKYVTSGKSGGTGLGTYSARLIAETLGGEIGMETSEAKGTIITVCFRK